MTNIIEFDAGYSRNCHRIHSLNMNYQIQALYWAYCDYQNNLKVNSSNTDGTNRQTIQLPFDCQRCDIGRYRITLYKDVFYLTSSDRNEIYKVQLNGENITTVVRSSDICRIYLWSPLKIVGEYRPQGDVVSLFEPV